MRFPDLVTEVLDMKLRQAELYSLVQIHSATVDRLAHEIRLLHNVSRETSQEQLTLDILDRMDPS